MHKKLFFLFFFWLMFSGFINASHLNKYNYKPLETSVYSTSIYGEPTYYPSQYYKTYFYNPQKPFFGRKQFDAFNSKLNNYFQKPIQKKIINNFSVINRAFTVNDFTAYQKVGYRKQLISIKRNVFVKPVKTIIIPFKIIVPVKVKKRVITKTVFEKQKKAINRERQPNEDALIRISISNLRNQYNPDTRQWETKSYQQHHSFQGIN